jgi:Ca2+-transporting ATPase
MNWHCLDIKKVMQLTGSSPEGLSYEDASLKLKEYGFNLLQEKKRKKAWQIFFKQFMDFMILILVAAAIISGFIGDMTDTIIILVIVILNAVVGFIQEYRAEKAMEALKKMTSPHATIIRSGKTLTIDSSLLVPGDLVLLEAGIIVPADLRLMETYSLQTDEATLTGESLTVDKTYKPLHVTDLSLGDRVNMAYKGTMVTAGRGSGIVVATGMDTEIGHIARLLQEKENLTPLQKRMNDFGRKLSYIILFVCAVLFGVGLLRGEDTMNMLLVAISLAVAAIPEALPALITVALARGAKRLAKKNALIRKLPAVETLGSVTFICTDKTGTLTQNKMKVEKIIPHSSSLKLHHQLSLLECFMAVNHNAKKTEAGGWSGDPTEIALVEYIEQQHGEEIFRKVREQLPRIAELPFDSDRKCMTTVHQFNNKFIAITKGAVESIVAILQKQEINKNILGQAHQLAAGGIRVLAYAYKVMDALPEPFSYAAVENNMIFAGLAGMADPPREEVKAAIKDCKTAGIHPVMITGDHRETAAAIAQKIGMLAEHDLVITGKELSNLASEELDEKVERIKVYARVSPLQKLDIVKSLQRKNHFVAMTGDGINDAPALKAADIGVAMGITGTDVSKEAAHMILLDDNFATIVKAVKEGRRIYDNIRKFIKYIMTCNGAEIWTIFLAPFLGLPIPLLPIHILWINLITDGLPGLALTTEKAEHSIMKRPPRRPDENLFAEGTGYHIVWVGLLMAFITLGIQAWSVSNGNTHWQTMVFTVLSLAQLGHVFAVRSDREFIYRKGILTNKPLLWALVISFILQLSVIYFPFGNKLFKTEPLTIPELAICIGASIIIFHAVELEKWIKIKRIKTGSNLH